MVTIKREQMNTVMSEEHPQKTKRVSVSSNRQINIPKEFYDALNTGNEGALELHGN